MTEESCQFCKIVNGENDANIIYEDEKTIAFMDIKPVNDGHTLVVTKNHYMNIYDIPEDEICYLYRTVKKMAVAVKKGVQAEGISVTQHNEKAAHQQVLHIHVHVIPRYQGQRFPRPEELSLANSERLKETAEKIRKYV